MLGATRARFSGASRPAWPPSTAGPKIRIHGDYHLGQVLLTRNDFILIDFEGEPGHSLEERRAKHSPLRDVAGMLRSFSYVGHSALRTWRTTMSSLPSSLRSRGLGTTEVRSAFLAAYEGAARGANLYYRCARAGIAASLGLFELEKALYELRYEIGNRPAWAGVPLQGILEWGVTMISNIGRCAALAPEVFMQSLDLLPDAAREFLHQTAQFLPRLPWRSRSSWRRLADRQGHPFRGRDGDFARSISRF